jgi:hypothetical protein
MIWAMTGSRGVIMHAPRACHFRQRRLTTLFENNLGAERSIAIAHRRPS